MMMPHSIMPSPQSPRPLDLLIAVMAFLAALALGATLVADRVAQGWQNGLSGKLTVQILPPAEDQDGMKRETEAALALLRATPGIARANALTAQEQAELVRPWLGEGDIAAELPLPQLIDADIVPGSTIDIERLTTQLKKAAPDALVDDHTVWMERLRHLSHGVIWSAGFILFLIAVATAAAVAFATRARLETHREMVELLHQMGAQSSFIARIFEWQTLRTTAVAALFGTGLAAFGFVLVGGLDSAGVEAVPFLPPLGLAPTEIIALVLVPMGAGIIGLVTARLSVRATLAKIY